MVQFIPSDSLDISVIEETLRQELDSIKTVLDLMEHHSRPYEFLNIDTTGPSFWIAVAGIALSIAAAFFGWRGYVHQKRAAESLTKISTGNIKFEEYTVNFHQNLVNLLAMDHIIQNSKGIPKEAMLDRLYIPDDVVELNIYEEQPLVYKLALQLKMQIRDFNFDVNYLKSLIMSTSLDKTKIEHEIGKLCYRLMTYIVTMSAIDTFSSTRKKRRSILTPMVVIHNIFKSHLDRVRYMDYEKTRCVTQLHSKLDYIIKPLIDFTTTKDKFNNLNELHLSVSWKDDENIYPQNVINLFSFAKKIAASPDKTAEFSFPASYKEILLIEVEGALKYMM